MHLKQVDINCDMGEGMPIESAIFPFISSANIACGGHTGNTYTMEKTVNAALEAGVSLGAHPSFADPENFGRKIPVFHPAQLRTDILDQLEALARIVEKQGAKLSHVKPHGALYNLSAKDENIASLIADCILEFNPALILYGLSGSLSISVARRKGLQTASEVFADRGYLPDGSLKPRSSEAALLEQESEWLSQLDRFLQGKAPAGDEDQAPLNVDTICIHSDSPKALEIAKSIHNYLKQQEVAISALV